MGSSGTSPSSIAQEARAEAESLDREIQEIDLLIQQARVEATRHEERRAHAAERLRVAEGRGPSAIAEMQEAVQGLIAATRRASLMETQVDVLEGKRRALNRFRERMRAIATAADAGGTSEGGDDAATASTSSRTLLTAQEDLRRDIARQMHDGPAQSIANIALQAHVVQRLFERQPKQAQAELAELVRMVEHALTATKEFIFDVRPMVLDDLGLVPTLRRSSLERGRRAGVVVRFESVGADRRLKSELESALFRVIDDAMSGYLSGSPAALTVKLDWTQRNIGATIHASTAEATQSAATRAHAVVTAARHERTMPAALASMIREQEADATLRATGLPEATWNEIQMRAEAAQLQVTLSSDRSTLEVSAATG